MVATETSQLVVVGASSGGIEALSTLVASLPPGFPAPIVVAQHLDPRRRSHLPEILARRTDLQIRSVDEVDQLQAGVVYLVPADHDVEITDHDVRLRPSGPKHRSKPSVDRLLSSAAQAFGEQLIAVILTGEGSDGAEGARAVKAAGGTVIIQDPRSAAHPSMPLSLAPTTVDFSVPLEDIGAMLGDLLDGGAGGRRATMDEDALDRFLAQVRDRTGIDFASYKRPTITRRLQRRMTAVGAGTLPEYVRFVARNPGEYERLASAFLIKVTDFFRDPDLYDYLRRATIPSIVKEAAQRNREIRIWSAGTATGEEAYSLAILVAEVLGDELPQYDVRVFATDLDPDAIDFARRGVYTRSALSGLPQELIDRYFQPLGDDFEISKQIRALTVFGQHDLGQRAPFPRIDLAVTRNVLIYFTTELQKRALQLFAFSLRQGGVLVLGKAESVTPLPEYFLVEEARLKVYRRHGDRVLIPPSRAAWVRDVAPPMPRPQSLRSTYGGVGDPRQVRERPTMAEKAETIVLHAPLGLVLIDASYDIQLINGAARRLLRIHGTAIDQDLVHVATAIPSDELRRGIDLARRGTDSSIEVATDDPTGTEPRILRLRFAGHRPDRTEEGTGGVVIVVDDVSDDVRTQAEGERRLHVAESEAQAFARRAELLAASNDELLAANHELTVANVELRSANEELLVGSEEVQAATEEVETLNEELQATNEELETLNEELQATVEELNTTNDDLEARSAELEQAAAASRAARQPGDDPWTEFADRLVDGLMGVVVVDQDGGILVSSELWADLVRGDRLTLEDGSALDGPGGVLERVAAGAVVDGTLERRMGRAVERLAVHAEPLRGRAGQVRGGMVTIRRLRGRRRS